MRCEYIEGVPRTETGVKLIHCRTEATIRVTVNGLSPLNVCPYHAARYEDQLSFFRPERCIK